MPATLRIRHTRAGLSILSQGKVVHKVPFTSYMFEAVNAFATGWYGQPMHAFGTRFYPSA